MAVRSICEEYCRAYHPDVAEFTSVYDYEMCLGDCEDLYNILKELVESVIAGRCRSTTQSLPEGSRERAFRGCVGYSVNNLISRKDLVEDLLKLVAADLLSP